MGNCEIAKRLPDGCPLDGLTKRPFCGDFDMQAVCGNDANVPVNDSSMHRKARKHRAPARLGINLDMTSEGSTKSSRPADNQYSF